MAILSKTVPVKIAYNPEYYVSRGYKIPIKKPSQNNFYATKENRLVYDYNTTVDVKIEDVLPGSQVLVDVQCDYCGKIKQIRYKNYYLSVSKNGKYACCAKCAAQKSSQTNLTKYGVRSVMHVPEFKDKCLQKVNDPNKKDERIKKMQQTMMDRYGQINAMFVPSFKNKMFETNMERYGGTNSHCSPDVVRKAEETMLKRYGVRNYTQSDEFKTKMAISNTIEKHVQTMYLNGTTKCSQQQQYIYDFYKQYYNCELNYPIKSYAGDIVFIDELIDYEIDYPGHNLSVTLGTYTEEEFNRRQLIRDRVVEQCGYNRIRLISTKESKVPSESILLNIIDMAIQYFNNTKHHWMEFYIEYGIYKSAEYPNGVQFDFGILQYPSFYNNMEELVCNQF